MENNGHRQQKSTGTQNENKVKNNVPPNRFVLICYIVIFLCESAIFSHIMFVENADFNPINIGEQILSFFIAVLCAVIAICIFLKKWSIAMTVIPVATFFLYLWLMIGTHCKFVTRLEVETESCAYLSATPSVESTITMYFSYTLSILILLFERSGWLKNVAERAL